MLDINAIETESREKERLFSLDDTVKILARLGSLGTIRKIPMLIHYHYADINLKDQKKKVVNSPFIRIWRYERPF